VSNIATAVSAQHEHVVAVYDRDDELISEVASFFSDALSGNGTAVVVATAEHRAALDVVLSARGFDLVGLRGSGRYRALDARELLAQFMVGDAPDPASFAASIGALVAEAEAAGGPLCVFGEMVALLWDSGLVAAAIELESLWNDLAARHTFALFCAYASSLLTASADLAAAKQMCDHHSRVVALPATDAAHAVTAADGCIAYERLFVATASQVRSVRDFVRESLLSWDDDAVDSEAEVIASELATNAVRHACSPFRVSIAVAPATVRVAVRDASFDHPELRTGDSETVGGRGMRLIAALAQSWGSDAEPDGKTVWADVERRAAP
jgi:anti-sigma regulatory factor (Ser/Thr protein kinase)